MNPLNKIIIMIFEKCRKCDQDINDINEQYEQKCQNPFISGILRTSIGLFSLALIVLSVFFVFIKRNIIILI